MDDFLAGEGGRGEKNAKHLLSKDIYSNLDHSCGYYDIEKFNNMTKNLTNTFSIFSLNIRSLPKKLDSLKMLIQDINQGNFKFNIIGLQEVWSLPESYDYSFTGYSKIEFNLRNNNSRVNCGGGVAFLIDEEVEYEILTDLSLFIPHTFESIFVKVKGPNNKFTVIGNIYRPPSANINRFNEHLTDQLNKLKENNLSRDLTLIGDFNINLLNYSKHNDTSNYVDLLLDNELLPLIVLPSRISDKTATIIDHISTNIKDDNYNTGLFINDISDHFPVFYIRETKYEKTKPTIKKVRIMNEINQVRFRNLLYEQNWEGVVNEQDPEKSFKNFFKIFNELFNLCFPEIDLKPNKNKIKIHPWMSNGLLTSRKRKLKLLNKKIISPTNENITIFKHYNRVYVSLCRQAKFTYYNERFIFLAKDVKQTWNVINKALGRGNNKENIPKYFVSNGHILSHNLDIANGFNDFFSSVGPNLANDIPPSNINFEDFLTAGTDESFTFANITKEIILDNLKKLKSKSSSGPDNVSSKLLKSVIEPILKPLVHLFNRSFKTGYIPPELKTAKVIPIFKSGDKHCFNNYRPISLLSTFSKLMEKIVASQMIKYMSKHNILYKHQYGFRKGHNTTHPVVHFLNNIYENLNKRNPEYNLSVFIDLKKAFDTCDFDILLKKLAHYGFRGIPNKWFENYLRDRTQYTVINGVSSSKSTLFTGVPQGSVLGPILFLILINDLANISDKLFTILFADDTTFQFSSNDLRELYNTANQELIKASDWFKANKLTLNVSKTKYILFRGKTQEHLDLSQLDIQIDGQSVERVGKNCTSKSFKFVGIHLDEFLTWEYHIEKVRNKLASANFAISRVKTLFPCFIKKNIYNSLFKSHLEYGLICWGGVKPSKLHGLFMLQKKVIRHIAGKGIREHSDPLFKSLKILKLADLMKLQGSCFMYRHINKKCPPSFEDTFKQFHGDNRSKNYVPNFPLKASLNHFPSYQLPTTWNNLTLTYKSIDSLRMFKDNLKELFLSSYIS